MTRTTLPPGRRLVPLGGLVVAVSLLAAGPARPDRLPDDPVEKFRQALIGEEKKSYAPLLEGQALALALDHRKQALTKAAANVKSLSDLSQALLLIDWPATPRNRAGESPFALKARAIEQDVRKSMIDRFVTGLRKGLKEGKPGRQVAVANLIGETVSGASYLPDERLALFEGVAPLADDLVRLARSNEATVRTAAARALGQFPTRPGVVAGAMKGLLSDRKASLAAREAAAEALGNLAQFVSPSRPLRPSVPGSPAPVLQQSQKAVTNELVADVLTSVVPAAAVGLSDPSARVRERCAQALRLSAATLASVVDFHQRTVASAGDLPPTDRPWSANERKAALARAEDVARFTKLLAPAIQAFATNGQALQSGALDTNGPVRTEVRRTLRELTRARRYLNELRASTVLPKAGEKKDDEKKKKDTDVEARARPGALLRTSAIADEAPGPLPALRLPPPPVGALRQDQKKPKKDPDKAKDEPADKDEDALGRLLRSVGDTLVEKGFTDPRAESRRAAVEAIESAGDIGKKYVPQLVKGLSDKDVFVRWIAARALAKLAPESPTTVVPALVRQLGDEDLDARSAAVKALGQYGPLAKSAVAPLGKIVEKGDSDLRLLVLAALEEIGTASAAALPSIAVALADLDPRIREQSARLIGRFGSRARAYGPALQKLTSDPDTKVRREASAAVLAVEEDD